MPQVVLTWLFVLVLPYCFDAKAGRAVGLGGLRLGVKRDCNRPRLWPDKVEDPIAWMDFTFRPTNVAFLEGTGYDSLQVRRTVNAGNRAQRARLREQMAARRVRRETDAGEADKAGTR